MSLHLPTRGEFIPDDSIRLLLRFTERVQALVEGGERKNTDIIPIENIFRYLEQYRYDAFDWRDAHTHESIFERKARKRAEENAKDAITNAAEVVFPQKDREWVAVTMQEALRAHWKRESIAGLENAKRFFAQLKTELEQRK